MRGVRRQIVDHLTRAHREVPAVTYVEECDFSNVDLKQLLPTVLQATAAALQEFPELNARLEGDEIVYLDRYDLGIAVQTDEGLVVPVVRGCDTRSVDELRADIDALAERARSGKLDAAELRGSTFTVTSAGKLAGLFVTPLVNHPEVGILGVHRIAPRPVVRDGEIVVRADRQHQRHVRPPRRRRRARRAVHARRDRPARSLPASVSFAAVGDWYTSGSSSGSAPRSASPQPASCGARSSRSSSPRWSRSAIGFAIWQWDEAAGGVVGAICGALGSAPLVAGALRRGGTRGGTATLLGVAALVGAALAFVPVVGYLEAIAVPVLGARLRRRSPDKHAGLRSLARD